VQTTWYTAAVILTATISLFKQVLNFPLITVIPIAVFVTTSCTSLVPSSSHRTSAGDPAWLSTESLEKGLLSDETLALNASAPPLEIKAGRILLDNDSAFEQKLELIRGARESLDLAYYIFENDYSSSLLATELIAAARRGVRVRILLDYFNNYLRLDYLHALSEAALGAEGTLEIRLYGRPTDHIIGDALYMTLGCAELGLEDDLAACAEEKTRVVQERISAARTGLPSGQPVDYNSGDSGIFLSGLYGMNAGLLAHTVLNTQDISLGSSSEDDGGGTENKEKNLRSAIAFAKLYWKARASNDKTFQQTAAQFKLDLAFLMFGSKLNPLFDALSAYLPIRQLEDPGAALRDWGHLTDFMHHKLLLADSRSLILGGRNVADAYHMRKNPMVDHYVFLDTDIRIDLHQASPPLTTAFEGLWNFRPMVATLDQVDLHAPNDFLMATLAADAACGKESKTEPETDSCRERVFTRSMDRKARIARARNDTHIKTGDFNRHYQPRESSEENPDILMEPGVTAYYLENLPYDRSVPVNERERGFGSVNGREGHNGKHIHNVWLSGMANSCNAASVGRPQRIVLNNAYLLPPSNLMGRLADMIDGTLDCGNVTIDVLTNSAESTDLSIINFFARYSLKAIADYYLSHHHPDKGATLRYFELRQQGPDPDVSELSLHSKDLVLGPDLFIGSANLDARSLLMDSNNGLLLRGARVSRSAYLDWFDRVLDDGRLVENETGWLVRTSLDAMIKDDRVAAERFFSRLLGRLTGDDKIPTTPLVDEVERLLRLAYELSAGTLRGGEDAAKRFNAQFKFL
jgi:phosphatidylserine/phosphatidylglycerophosphate/cardiolipin synthase-like enzyme